MSAAGTPDPAPVFAELRPLVARLRALQRQCRPFGPDYHAICVSLAALDETAEALTGRGGFFGAQNDTVGPIRPR